MKKLLILTLALTFSCFSFANKKIDIKKSSFKWTATKKVGSKHHGKILIKSADWKENDGQFTQATFKMDMTTFTVDDLKGKWAKKFLTHVKSNDFFEVKKYPEAKLVLTKKTKDSFEGTLTIKNKTQPIKIKFTQKDHTYSGKMVFDRTKFNVIYNSSNFFKKIAASKVINNDISIEFNVILK